MFDPELPPSTTALLRPLKPGNIIKFVVTYHDAFWLDDGLSGFACNWSHDSFPVHMVFDGTLSSGEPALLGFIAGSMAEKCGQIEVCMKSLH